MPSELGKSICRRKAPAGAGSRCASRHSTCTGSYTGAGAADVAPVLCSAVVPVKVIRLVKQREVKQVLVGVPAGIRALAGAAHVGHGRACSWVGGVRVEPLRPVIPTAGLGRVHQGQGWRHAIGCKAFLVEVDGDVRNIRLPGLLDHLRRIIKGTRRGIDDLSIDTAVLAHLRGRGRGGSRRRNGDGRASRRAGCIRRFAEINPVALACQPRPALGVQPTVDRCGRWKRCDELGIAVPAANEAASAAQSAVAQ